MGLLQVLQNQAAKVLLNLPPRSPSTEALDHLDLKPLSKRRHFLPCVVLQEYLSGIIDFKLELNKTHICVNLGVFPGIWSRKRQEIDMVKS